MKLDELLKVKNELVEMLEDDENDENLEIEFVIELVESHIEATKSESYWVDKCLNSLDENIKKLIEELKYDNDRFKTVNGNLRRSAELHLEFAKTNRQEKERYEKALNEILEIVEYEEYSKDDMLAMIKNKITNLK